MIRKLRTTRTESEKVRTDEGMGLADNRKAPQNANIPHAQSIGTNGEKKGGRRI